MKQETPVTIDGTEITVQDVFDVLETNESFKSAVRMKALERQIRELKVENSELRADEEEPEDEPKEPEE